MNAVVNIIQSYTTKNKAYKNANIFVPKGLILHSIGCPQPRASVLVNNYDDSSLSTSVHAFIDANDGAVYQTLPWNYRAVHVGAANDTHIGVEMCEPAQIKYVGGATITFKQSDLPAIEKAARTTYDSAVQLFAELCKEFGLDPLADGVILSHNEAYKRGIGTGHEDPEHLWRQANIPLSMDGFRRDVAVAMGATQSPSAPDKKPDKPPSSGGNASLGSLYRVRKTWSDAKSQLGAFSFFEKAKAMADAYPGYAVFDDSGKKLYPSDSEIKVQISSPNLNIRKGPGTNYATIGKFTGVGVFTVLEIQNGTGSKSGWGLLKSYATNRNGWISMDYAKKL